jgi:hypothetical protein
MGLASTCQTFYDAVFQWNLFPLDMRPRGVVLNGTYFYLPHVLMAWRLMEHTSACHASWRGV